MANVMPPSAPRPRTVRVPEGSVLLHESEFAVVDVETTGLHATSGDRIVEVAVNRIRADGTVLSSMTTLVNPGRDTGPAHIHGIRERDVRGAPAFHEIAGDVLELLRGAVLVAHNARFDLSFLDAEISRLHGIRAPSLKLSLPVLCTMKLSYRAAPLLKRRSLGSCCEHFGVPLSNAHSAWYDAIATSGLLVACVGVLEEKGAKTLKEAGGVLPKTAQADWPSLPSSGRRHLRPH